MTSALGVEGLAPKGVEISAEKRKTQSIESRARQFLILQANAMSR